jgi:hypothetical protein
MNENGLVIIKNLTIIFHCGLSKLILNSNFLYHLKQNLIKSYNQQEIILLKFNHKFFQSFQIWMGEMLLFLVTQPKLKSNKSMKVLS